MKTLTKVILLSILPILVMLEISSASNMPKRERDKFMSQVEKKLNLSSMIDKIENRQIPVKNVQIIYLILKNTGEYYAHNLNGAVGNQVFVHPDGHSEAVYDKNNQPVKDGINDPSYNYFSRLKEPLKHFSFDSNAWIIWGNTREDTTSKKERLKAFSMDFGGGIIGALQEMDQLKTINTDNFSADGQLQAIAIILLAIEKGKAFELFSLFEANNTKMDKETFNQVVKNIEKGLLEVYQ
jgi:hypothetical protein